MVSANHVAEAIVARLALSGVFDQRPNLRLLLAEHVLAFATDHPHPEGGRDPAARFQAATGDRDSAPFFSTNGAALIG